jgi:AcrR family transcriptional regulator
MSIVVEHEKRRNGILEKALDVFVDEGYQDATYQKIADRCGITRTTLYAYFRNKTEIFNYSIKLLLLKVEEDILRITANSKLDTADKITGILLCILQRLQENRRLLLVVLDYLGHLSRNGIDPNMRVRRRTLKMRHYLSTLLIEGMKNKELLKTKIKTADDFLYGFMEAAIFRLVVLKHENVDDLKDVVAMAVQRLKQ